MYCSPGIGAVLPASVPGNRPNGSIYDRTAPRTVLNESVHSFFSRVNAFGEGIEEGSAARDGSGRREVRKTACRDHRGSGTGDRWLAGSVGNRSRGSTAVWEFRDRLAGMEWFRGLVRTQSQDTTETPRSRDEPHAERGGGLPARSRARDPQHLDVVATREQGGWGVAYPREPLLDEVLVQIGERTPFPRHPFLHQPHACAPASKGFAGS